MRRNQFFVFVLAVAMSAAFTSYADDRVGDPYPLNYCAVTGEPLGSMGEPVVLVHEGREVRFCCDGCKPKFEADAAKYLASVDEKLTELQKGNYPLDTCVVSGKTLDENAETRFIGNRMMKFCCANCPKAAAGDPAKYIAKLDEAVITKQAAAYTLKTCVVSGEELGSMGDPVNKVVANRLIKLCCSGCEKELGKYPAKYLAALDGKTIEEGSEHK